MKSAEENYLLYAESRKRRESPMRWIARESPTWRWRKPRPFPHCRRAQVALLLLVGGAFIALVLGLAVTYLLDYITPYFHTPDDVERALAVPVLASIPSAR